MSRMTAPGAQRRERHAAPPLARRRRLTLFGAGPPKSGTHSIEGIFKQHYRAAHEPRRPRVIEARLGEVAAFADVPLATLSHDRSHQYKARRKHDLLHRIDRRFLEAKVARHAGELMARFFPDIGSLDDAGLRERLRLAS